MTTQAETTNAPEPDQTVEQKIQKLRELYADAPEVGKQALENILRARPFQDRLRTTGN